MSSAPSSLPHHQSPLTRPPPPPSAPLRRHSTRERLEQVNEVDEDLEDVVVPVSSPPDAAITSTDPPVPARTSGALASASTRPRCYSATTGISSMSPDRDGRLSRGESLLGAVMSSFPPGDRRRPSSASMALQRLASKASLRSDSDVQFMEAHLLMQYPDSLTHPRFKGLGWSLLRFFLYASGLFPAMDRWYKICLTVLVGFLCYAAPALNIFSLIDTPGTNLTVSTMFLSWIFMQFAQAFGHHLGVRFITSQGGLHMALGTMTPSEVLDMNRALRSRGLFLFLVYGVMVAYTCAINGPEGLASPWFKESLSPKLTSPVSWALMLCWICGSVFTFAVPFAVALLVFVTSNGASLKVRSVQSDVTNGAITVRQVYSAHWCLRQYLREVSNRLQSLLLVASILPALSLITLCITLALRVIKPWSSADCVSSCLETEGLYLLYSAVCLVLTAMWSSIISRAHTRMVTHIDDVFNDVFRPSDPEVRHLVMFLSLPHNHLGLTVLGYTLNSPVAVGSVILALMSVVSRALIH